jgi:hypothetical protein
MTSRPRIGNTRNLLVIVVMIISVVFVANYLFSFAWMSPPSTRDTTIALKILDKDNSVEPETCSKASIEFPDISDKKTTMCILRSSSASPHRTLQILHGSLWSLVYGGESKVSARDWLGGSCIRYLGNGWWLRHQAHLEDGSGWHTPLSQLCPFGLRFVGVG